MVSRYVRTRLAAISVVWCGCSSATALTPDVLAPVPFPSRTDVLAHVPLTSRTYSVAVSSAGVAYVGQPDLSRLIRADLPGTTFTTAISVGNMPTEVAFNWTGSTAYVTNQFSHTVGVIDVASNTQTTTIPVAGNPFAVIVAPGDSMVYTTTTADSLFGIRAATGEIAYRLNIPSISNGLAIHDSLLFVSTRDFGIVTEINVKTNTVLRTLNVGGRPQGIVISPDGTQLYVADETGLLQFWSLTTNKALGNVLLAGRGFGLALRPSDGDLYVTTLEAGEVQVVNPTSHRLVKSITVGGVARRIVFNTAGTIAVVANEGGWIDFLK